jgi:hypothetical protein
MDDHHGAMASFDDLQSAAPDIARAIRERIEATGLMLLGTVRADGSPRVSPVEVRLRDGDLRLGMMPGSRKALDVARDPRVALLTPVADKDDLGGEGKLFGVLSALEDPAAIADLFAAAVEGTDHAAADLEGSPAFEDDISGAAWQQVDGVSVVTASWSPAAGLRRRRRSGATGEVIDVP